MKLVVDSGSTKTDWGFFNTVYDLKAVKTQGINPCHQSEEEIRTIIKSELIPNLQAVDLNAVSEVFYYGAGCATESICAQMAGILKEFLPNAVIKVDSDMLGAARALCGHSEGVACVLGTGSNSCLFNGKEIEDQVPSLGFILGDEGSSAALGRRLISDCLKRQLPESVSLEFIIATLLIEDERGAKRLESLDVGIHAAAAYLVASGLANSGMTQTGQQRTQQHDRAAKPRAAGYKVHALSIVAVYLIGLE